MWKKAQKRWLFLVLLRCSGKQKAMFCQQFCLILLPRLTFRKDRLAMGEILLTRQAEHDQ
jgi:hypothetical protein